MSRFALALAAVAAVVAPAAANGRLAATSTIHFRTGHETDIVAGMTFGLVTSHDGGATWQWMCEDAIGYGGLYDPIYGYGSSGTLFATTFSGLKASRDGCTFGPLAPGSDFASTDELGPDGTYYYGQSMPAASLIYKSTDDGVTFGSGVSPPNGKPNDWWQSIRVAPSDVQRVYLFGYRFAPDTTKTFLLYKSTDAGATYTPISTTGLVTSPSSAIEVAAIDRTNPDIVYAHVTQANGMMEHGLYRSADAGAHWTPLYTISDRAFAFVARANGDLILGTVLGGVFVSHDAGVTWTALAGAPHVNCLAENSAHEVWACTQNYSVPAGPASDGAGIMKTTDGVTWTPVLRYEDITQPVACAAGTPQHDSCQVDTWCGLKAQLGITSTALDCSGAQDQPPGIEAPILHPPRSGGCCDAGGEAPTGGLLTALVLGLAWWRRPARGKHP